MSEILEILKQAQRQDIHRAEIDLCATIKEIESLRTQLAERDKELAGAKEDTKTWEKNYHTEHKMLLQQDGWLDESREKARELAVRVAEAITKNKEIGNKLVVSQEEVRTLRKERNYVIKLGYCNIRKARHHFWMSLKGRWGAMVRRVRAAEKNSKAQVLLRREREEEARGLAAICVKKDLAINEAGENSFWSEEGGPHLNKIRFCCHKSIVQVHSDKCSLVKAIRLTPTNAKEALEAVQKEAWQQGYNAGYADKMREEA